MPRKECVRREQEYVSARKSALGKKKGALWEIRRVRYGKERVR